MARETRASSVSEPATVIFKVARFSSFLSAMAYRFWRNSRGSRDLARTHGVNGTTDSMKTLWRHGFRRRGSWECKIDLFVLPRHRRRTSYVLKAWRDTHRVPRFQEKLHVPSTVAVIPFRNLPRLRGKMIQSASAVKYNEQEGKQSSIMFLTQCKCNEAKREQTGFRECSVM